MGGKVNSNQADNAAVPGPGHYDMQAADAACGGAAAPAWTMAQKVAGGRAVAATGPGPGSYDVQAPSQQGPAYTMQGRTIVSSEHKNCCCVRALELSQSCCCLLTGGALWVAMGSLADAVCTPA